MPATDSPGHGSSLADAQLSYRRATYSRLRSAYCCVLAFIPTRQLHSVHSLCSVSKNKNCLNVIFFTVYVIILPIAFSSVYVFHYFCFNNFLTFLTKLNAQSDTFCYNEVCIHITQLFQHFTLLTETF
jgi:hypothetical protein